MDAREEPERRSARGRSAERASWRSPPTTPGPSASYGQGAPSRTLIEHWDGTAWSVVPSPNKGPFPNALSDVDAVAPDDIWAVGTWFTKAFDDRTLTLHWDGTAWSRVASPNAGPTSAANDLVSVSAVATDDVWAVGLRGLKTLAMHWDGTAWAIVPSPTPEGNADLAAVVALATDDVWAVGGFVEPHGERRPHARRALGRHELVGRGEREQGAERQPPVGDLRGDRTDARRRRPVHRRRHRPAGPALAGALRARGSDAPCVSARGPTIRSCPRSVSPPTSSPPATSPRPSDSSPRAWRPARSHLTLLGATGTGKTFTIAHVVEAHPASDPGDRAQQVARRAAGQRVPRGLPRQRGRVLRQLLRLLPARGVHPDRPTRTSRRTRR